MVLQTFEIVAKQRDFFLEGMRVRLELRIAQKSWLVDRWTVVVVPSVRNLFRYLTVPRLPPLIFFKRGLEIVGSSKTFSE